MITGGDLTGKRLWAYRMVGIDNYHLESVVVSRHVDGELNLRDHIESLGFAYRIYQNDRRVFLTKEEALQDIRNKVENKISDLQGAVEVLKGLDERLIMDQQGIKE